MGQNSAPGQYGPINFGQPSETYIQADEAWEPVDSSNESAVEMDVISALNDGSPNPNASAAIQQSDVAQVNNEAQNSNLMSDSLSEHSDSNDEAGQADDGTGARDRGKTLKTTYYMLVGLLGTVGTLVYLGLAGGAGYLIYWLAVGRRAAQAIDKVKKPTADAQMSLRVEEDNARTITLSGQPDPSKLTYAIVGEPKHGKVVLNSNVAVYTPSKGYVGEDQFTFRVSDGKAASEPATVSLTVFAKANPPVTHPQPSADNKDATINQGAKAEIMLSGMVSGNDTLSFTITRQPGNGTLDTSALPKVIYTPHATFTGEDSFEYTATSLTGNKVSAAAEVVILVNASVVPENGVWLKSVNTPPAPPAKVTQAVETLRNMTSDAFWDQYWASSGKNGFSISVHARILQRLADLLAPEKLGNINRPQDQAALKSELYGYGKAARDILLKNYKASTKEVKVSDLEAAITYVRNLKWNRQDRPLSRLRQFQVLIYALNQALVKQGYQLDISYNIWCADDFALTTGLRLKRLNAALDKKVWLYIRPASLDIKQVQWQLDGVNKQLDTVPEYQQAVDTTALRNGTHTLKAIIDFESDTGQTAQKTTSVTFVVNNN